MLTFREGAAADAVALAAVHVQSWRETYADLVPDSFLSRMTDAKAEQRRADNWQRTLEKGLEWVNVAEQDGQVVAFASAAPARDHPGFSHELMTLYSLKRVQGQGIGYTLFQRTVQGLALQGAQNLALWVLAENPTLDWYRRQGGREAGEKVIEVLGGQLREVRIVWDTLP